MWKFVTLNWICLTNRTTKPHYTFYVLVLRLHLLTGPIIDTKFRICLTHCNGVMNYFQWTVVTRMLQPMCISVLSPVWAGSCQRLELRTNLERGERGQLWDRQPDVRSAAWFLMWRFGLPAKTSYIACDRAVGKTLSTDSLVTCPRWLTIYSPVVTIYTASLTFNSSTFCPHSVIMCFVWIWEQTAIISLYSINWLVSITEI